MSLILLSEGVQGGGGVPLLPAQGTGSPHLSRDQWLSIVFDDVKNGIRAVDAGAASGQHGTTLDAPYVWRLVFDPSVPGMRVTILDGTGTTPGTSRFDARQAVKDVFDPVLQALRVCTAATPVPMTSWRPDASQIIKFIHIPSIHAFAIDTPLAGSGTYGDLQSGDEILKESFDHATGQLVIVS